MPRSLGPCMKTSFVCDLTYLLAPVVIMIRMTVTPLPICLLLLLFHFRKRPILSVSLAEVQTIGMVFVVIPIVIVPVVAVVEPVAVLIVSMVFFLTPVVLLPGRSHYCRWSGKGCSKQKRIEEISIATVHVVLLLARDSRLGNLGTQRACICNLAEAARYCTSGQVIRIYSRPGKTPQFGRSDQVP
jgi:hypothetical protein